MRIRVWDAVAYGALISLDVVAVGCQLSAKVILLLVGALLCRWASWHDAEDEDDGDGEEPTGPVGDALGAPPPRDRAKTPWTAPGEI